MSRIRSRSSRREPVPPTLTSTNDFSHLSIEVGRFSVAEVAGDRDLVRRRCLRAAGWLPAVRASADTGRSPLRSSTCVLLDDYRNHGADPATVIGTLLTVTEEAGLPIDYVAHTAGLAVGNSGAPDQTTVAQVAARLVSEPPPGANGSRPPVQDSGWLCNGRRSPAPYGAEAMRARSWAPPEEYAGGDHSIFVDVELWRDKILDGAAPGFGNEAFRLWSPAILAASWLLLRLGQLNGVATSDVDPAPPPAKAAGWPERWTEVPAVVKINRDASPLTAYRAVSIAPRTDLPLEHAVRLVLESFAVDTDAAARIESSAADEGLVLETEISDRLSAVLYPPES